MKSTLHVQVKSRGRITLPKEWRAANNIEDGDVILFAEAGNGVIIMQHKKSRVNQVADEFAQELRKKGITLKDIRNELKKIRK